MNKNQNHQATGNGHAAPVVRLEFIHPTARKVAVAGTFNDWRPEATQMISLDNGRWVKELVLPAGRYEYQLVADGKWLPDPNAKASVPNPFGGVNSIMEVEDSTKPGSKGNGK